MSGWGAEVREERRVLWEGADPLSKARKTADGSHREWADISIGLFGLLIWFGKREEKVGRVSRLQM